MGFAHLELSFFVFGLTGDQCKQYTDKQSAADLECYGIGALSQNKVEQCQDPCHQGDYGKSNDIVPMLFLGVFAEGVEFKSPGISDHHSGEENDAQQCGQEKGK